MEGSLGDYPLGLSQLSWGSDSVLFVTSFSLAWLVLSERLPWRSVVDTELRLALTTAQVLL